jgi:alanine racemase
MVNLARARPVENIRPTRAFIDMGALAHNLDLLRREAPHSRVFGVIKADGYGHGAVEVAKALAQEGVDGLCVALPEEGIELRHAGLRLPILVLGGVYAGGAAETVAYGLTPVVHDLDQVEHLHQASRGKSVNVHVKVDTGMSRLGVPLSELPRFLWRMRRYPTVVVQGVMSHLASAESDGEATEEQIDRFQAALTMAAAAGFRPQWQHLANSAGILRYPEAHFNLVRPGLALFGVSPVAQPGLALRPVMSVRTEVVHLRHVESGAAVSYGGHFVAQRPTVVAVLPLGYADGLSSRMSGRGSLLVRGCRAPVVGAVCMDMCMVDVTDIPGVTVGDEAVLLGGQGKETVTAEELATVYETVPHEVLTSVSRRVPRLHFR